MRIGNSQKGFTLVELLVGTAVGGMLLSTLVAAIFQTFNVTADTRTRITAIGNINNATHQLSKDVRMAASTNLVDEADPVSNLVLDWSSWYDDSGQLSSEGQDHNCEYALSGEELQRSYDSGDPATVARHISAIEFSLEGQIIIVSITSSPEGKPETAEQKTYRLYLRPKEYPVQ